MKRNRLLFISTFLLILSCKKEATIKTEITEKIINSEKIDGSANIRDTINGKVLFTLKNNAKVDVIDSKSNWYKIMVFIDSLNIIDQNLKKGDSIFQNNKTIGISNVDLKAFEFYENSHFIEGYTYKNNIQKESIIELVIISNLENRAKKNWNKIIEKYNLEKRNDFLHYNAFELLENNDISPGFRVLLLFENQQLIGYYHSRKIESDLIDTYKLNSIDKLSFYKDYDKNKAKFFINFMKNWLEGVD
ncbi:hypothetical protein [Olleya sp. R77988]|uniref:hypothetical protein n=1 Tax=Olleya sp. R77988 TaxID=3093875 RepID=UPI0037C715D8